MAISLVTLLFVSQGCLFDDDGDGDNTVTNSITGRVLALDKDGIKGAIITLSGTKADNELFAPRTALSDSGGYYIFEGITDGSYSIVPELQGYRFAPVQLSVVIAGESVNPGSFTATEFEPDEYAEYTITFTSTWSAETHPLDFPQTPHFSPIIGAYHNERLLFWEEGGLATPGIRELAETGARNIVTEEILAAIDSDDANVLLWGGGIPVSPGSVTITFTAHRNFHYVTLASMLAPSPDWFVGVAGLDLFSVDDWNGNIVVDLYLYDAGTDSGETYTAQNYPTPDPEKIRIIDGYAFTSGGKTVPVGTMTFIRTGFLDSEKE
ncbi:MAG: hypothetical protein HOC71_15275 [Candidatus Latescibacteria bacterium]|nr:hypothetical protein [Candidatus Latescibacterota bacterium]